MDFTWSYDATGTAHARHITTDTGWKISLDRGLDIFQMYPLNDAFILSMRVEEAKELFRDHDVIYVYHNRIDVVGDAMRTEERLPEAAEAAIEDLVTLVRKLG